MSAVLLAVVLIHLCLTNFASSQSAPVIQPARDSLIARGSPENVTYSCWAEEDDLYWELNGRQIQGEMEKAMYRNASIFIEDQTGSTLSSSLTVTLEGRRALGDSVRVLCLAFSQAVFSASPGKTVYIIQFDAPYPPGNLQLNYQSEDQLILQWERPTNLHEDVDVTYLIQIANLTSGDVTQEYETTATYILINQTVDERCQPHIFTVTARNDAGVSSGTSIQESIPISPDVHPIANSQRVEQVLFLDDGNVNITISFEPATNCSTQFPVINYTVSIEGLEGSLTIEDASDYSSTLSVVLSSSAFPELVQDQQYSIVITACTNFTCRSPLDALLAVTADVQSASIAFFERTVSVNCTFAVASSARGCLFVLTLTNEGQTENVSISHREGDTSNASCAQLSNTIAAYSVPIPVYGIDSDGTVGSQPIYVSATMETEEDNFPCPLPSAAAASDDGISTGAISGISVAGALALIFFVLFILTLVFIFYLMHRIRQRKPKGSKIKWSDIKEEVDFVIERVKGRIRADDAEEEPLTAEEIEIERFPVAKIVKSSKSMTIQLLESPEIDKWVRSWASEDSVDISLYPRKKQKVPQETEL